MEVFILFILMAKEWDQEKWEKKWDKMDPWERDMAIRNTADFYGIEGARPGGRPGEFWEEDERRTDEVLRDLNDHWTNGAVGTYLMASGQDLPLASDAAGMIGVHKQLESGHESGGAFNNQSDVFLQAANAWDGAFDNIEFEGPVEEPEVEPEPVIEEEPYVVSTTVSDARDNVEAIHNARRNGTYRSDAIFGGPAAANELAGKFVLNLSNGMIPSVQSNVRNSIDLVLGNKNPELDRKFGTGIQYS